MSATSRLRVRGQARDQLGHWVAPPSQRGHPCHHACCQGKRPHPKNTPVKISREYLRSLTDEEVWREVERYHHYQDTHENGYLQVIAEATRREEVQERKAANRKRLGERNRQAAQEYSDHVYREWLAAEAATNGVMLNKRGLHKKISERAVITGSQEQFDRYASDELRDFFLTRPRLTRRQYDRQKSAEMLEEKRRAGIAA